MGTAIGHETWCPRGCNPYRDAVDVDAIHFDVVENQPAPYDKAGTVNATKKILVDKTWFGARALREKHAILAHEHGHTIGISCEDCCDRHAGYLMARWGYTVPAIRGAFGFMTRPDRMGAGDRAAQGAAYSTTASASGAGVDSVKSDLVSRLRGAATPAGSGKSPPPPPTTRAVQLPVDVPKDSTGTKVTITDPSFLPAQPTAILDDVNAVIDEAQKAPRAVAVGAVASGIVVALLVLVVVVWGKS